MAKTLVKNEVCEACGSEVRGGSSFCYNCGESLDHEPAPPAILKPNSVPLNGRDIRSAETEALHEPEPPPVAIPYGSPHAPAKPAAKTQAFPAAVNAEPARRVPRTRTRARKAAEVEWAERSSLSIGFVIAAVVFAVIAALLVVAALSLR